MINRRNWHLSFGVLLLAFVMTLPSGQLAAQETGESSLPEVYSAFAIVMGNIATGHTEGLTINITRWSTPEERESLIDTIVEGGGDAEATTRALRDALQKQEETGFIRSSRIGDGGFPSERLRYAWEYVDPEDGSRRIILGLDRPIEIQEIWAATRTLQYTISLIVLDVEANGEGTGLITIGNKVHYDKETGRLVMEYYSTEPVRLTNVRKTS